MTASATSSSGALERNEPSSSTSSILSQNCQLTKLQPLVIVDDTHRFCDLCLKDFLERIVKGDVGSGNKRISMTTLTKYSLSTATSALKNHLEEKHNIKLTSAKSLKMSSKTNSVSKPQNTRINLFGNVSMACQKKTTSVNNDMLVWFALDLQPFSAVTDKGFQYFFSRHFHLPGVNLPSESTLRKTSLLNVYNELKVKVTDELSHTSCLCLMFDGWTDRYNKRHFLGIRACYIRDDWTSNVVTLSCKPSPQDADGMYEHILNELQTFGLKSEMFSDGSKFLFTTHDGANVMHKTSRLLKSKHVQHCCAHALHLLLMNDSVNKITELKDLLKHGRDVVTKLHFKGDLIEEELQKKNLKDDVEDLLNRIAKVNEILDAESRMPIYDNSSETESDSDLANATASELGEAVPESGEGDVRNSAVMQTNQKRYRHLQQECITRWNSALEMLKSLLSLRDAVNESLKRTGNYQLCIKTSEWDLMDQLCRLLQTFSLLCDVTSSELAGLSIIPLIRATVVSACKRNEADCNEIVKLKSKIIASLDHRFPINDTVNVATLLDPVSKNKKYIELPLENKRSLLLKALESMTLQIGNVSVSQNDSSMNEVNESTQPSSKRLRLMDTFDEETGEDSELSASIAQYLSVNEKATAAERENPLLYWRRCTCKPLAELARRYLTLSASSVAVESMFSTTGMLMNGRRSSLSPHHMNKLSFIHDNFMAFNK